MLSPAVSSWASPKTLWYITAVETEMTCPVVTEWVNITQERQARVAVRCCLPLEKVWMFSLALLPLFICGAAPQGPFYSQSKVIWSALEWQRCWFNNALLVGSLPGKGSISPLSAGAGSAATPVIHQPICVGGKRIKANTAFHKTVKVFQWQ